MVIEAGKLAQGVESQSEVQHQMVMIAIDQHLRLLSSLVNKTDISRKAKTAYVARLIEPLLQNVVLLLPEQTRSFLISLNKLKGFVPKERHVYRGLENHIHKIICGNLASAKELKNLSSNFGLSFTYPECLIREEIFKVYAQKEDAQKHYRKIFALIQQYDISWEDLQEMQPLVLQFCNIFISKEPLEESITKLNLLWDIGLHWNNQYAYLHPWIMQAFCQALPNASIQELLLIVKYCKNIGLQLMSGFCELNIALLRVLELKNDDFTDAQRGELLEDLGYIIGNPIQGIYKVLLPGSPSLEEVPQIANTLSQGVGRELLALIAPCALNGSSMAVQKMLYAFAGYGASVTEEQGQSKPYSCLSNSAMSTELDPELTPHSSNTSVSSPCGLNPQAPEFVPQMARI